MIHKTTTAMERIDCLILSASSGLRLLLAPVVAAIVRHFHCLGMPIQRLHACIEAVVAMFHDPCGATAIMPTRRTGPRVFVMSHDRSDASPSRAGHRQEKPPAGAFSLLVAEAAVNVTTSG